MVRRGDGVSFCVESCVRQGGKAKKTHTFSCGIELWSSLVVEHSLNLILVQGSNPMALQETNNSFFSAAYKTLTTNHYFSLMGHDV